MIILIALTVIAWTAYLYVDAREDYAMGLDGYNFSHKNNAKVKGTALSGYCLILVVILLNMSDLSGIKSLLYSLLFLASLFGFLCFYSWMFFDWIFARISKTPKGHIGSGNIDMWYKRKYKEKAFYVMLTHKIIGLFITFGLTIYSLYLNRVY